MKFKEWLAIYEENLKPMELSISDEMLVKAGWYAAKELSIKIAWECARQIRKPTGRQTRCDDIADFIRDEL